MTPHLAPLLLGGGGFAAALITSSDLLTDLEGTAAGAGRYGFVLGGAVFAWRLVDAAYARANTAREEASAVYLAMAEEARQLLNEERAQWAAEKAVMQAEINRLKETTS